MLWFQATPNPIVHPSPRPWLRPRWRSLPNPHWKGGSRSFRCQRAFGADLDSPEWSSVCWGHRGHSCQGACRSPGRCSWHFGFDTLCFPFSLYFALILSSSDLVLACRSCPTWWAWLALMVPSSTRYGARTIATSGSEMLLGLRLKRFTRILRRNIRPTSYLLGLLPWRNTKPVCATISTRRKQMRRSSSWGRIILTWILRTSMTSLSLPIRLRRKIFK